MTSTASTGESAPWEDDQPAIQVFEAPSFPSGHPAEPDLFVRQLGVPGHDQAALERARVVMVGAGGLGSWTGLGLVRSGVKHLTIIDPDRFHRSNAHRQLMFAADLGAPKASALARNLAPHMIAGGVIRAINSTFEDAIEGEHVSAADVLLVLVDNNRCRWAASRFARSRRIPAVFAMLSLDGMRMHSFLQGPCKSDACLWCALPNLDRDASAPCADGMISTCLAAAANVGFWVHRAIMGWSTGYSPFNWRSSDLRAVAQDSVGRVVPRQDCSCRTFRMLHHVRRA